MCHSLSDEKFLNGTETQENFDKILLSWASKRSECITNGFRFFVGRLQLSKMPFAKISCKSAAAWHNSRQLAYS